MRVLEARDLDLAAHDDVERVTRIALREHHAPRLRAEERRTADELRDEHWTRVPEHRRLVDGRDELTHSVANGERHAELGRDARANPLQARDGSLVPCECGHLGLRDPARAFDSAPEGARAEKRPRPGMVKNFFDPVRGDAAPDQPFCHEQESRRGNALRDQAVARGEPHGSGVSRRLLPGRLREAAKEARTSNDVFSGGRSLGSVHVARPSTLHQFPASPAPFASGPPR